ncbi:hypothetical protein [Acidovorax sp. 1608163]|uniref:hypothetical protein n=1 Tax=Acidovorax sp. 1608163 TaxID=2478662 RepID=UPI0013CEDE91|nr:hypothetical protein [Acidovorax sp. 1608163]
MPKKARIGSTAWAGQIQLNIQAGELVDPSTWSQIDEDALTEERRELFLRRKKAVLDYFDGASAQEIKQRWGMGRSQVYRLISERCLKTARDGHLFGWRGLIPHMRITPWTRQTTPEIIEGSGAGSAGSLQWLFSSPQNRTLEQKFRERILKTPTGLEGTRRSKQVLLRWFYSKLQENGVELRGEWPFNTAARGYTTICKFINKVLNENAKKSIAILGGQNAQKKSRAGDGTKRPIFNLFHRVECDAHKLDLRMVVMVPSPHGGYQPRKIHRLWVIVIIEVSTRAVLGYYLSMRREVGAEDVLRAVRNALGKWCRRTISFGEFAYSAEANFPSAVDPDFLGACWEEFSVDGALANTCARVEKRIKETVDCKIIKPQDQDSFSSRRSLDDRPFIETFFRTLAGGGSGLHNLSNSTKSKPADLKGDCDPAKKAFELQFQVEYLNELLDVIIANYNATPHHGLGYRTPLAQMKFLKSRKNSCCIRKADSRQVARLGATRKLCKLLGGKNSGRRPHFHFKNAQYSSEDLAHRLDLVGGNFWLTIENEDDARWATVSTQEGLHVCTVRAAPPWHQTPHSLYVRSAIRALASERFLHLTSSNDAVDELIKYSENQRDNKLPVHPAYLETRRILQAYSENIAINPSIDPISLNSYTQQSSNGLEDACEIPEIHDIKIVTKNNKKTVKNTNPHIADAPKKPVLLTMRKAKTW